MHHISINYIKSKFAEIQNFIKEFITYYRSKILMKLVFILYYIHHLMWAKRKNLCQELLGIEKPPKTIAAINFEKIIYVQQETIKILEKEINHLRQYLAYVADFSETTTQEKIDTEAVGELKTTSFIQEEQPSKKIVGLKGLISQIMNLVKANCPDEIIPQLKKMEEKANRKIEPVFLQKVKEKQVPIVIVRQVQKIVQKIKIEQKIIYKERPQSTTAQETISNDSYLNDNPNDQYYERSNNSYYKKDYNNSNKNKKYNNYNTNNYKNKDGDRWKMRQRSDRVKYKEKKEN